MSIAETTASPDLSEKHPAGLSTLFFTEMWERFSYYGMRALLVLFMVDQVQNGGLGLTDQSATAIYGLYTAAVYLFALPGGWVADRLLGTQTAVLVGGIIITSGHVVLAIPGVETFFIGLVLVVLGTGLLKPNVSAVVGDLYPEGGARRDAGFTIFYMGINLGATLGPLVCSYLGENVNWHYGFGAAAVGMAFGVIQFQLSRGRLGDAGVAPVTDAAVARRNWLYVIVGVGIIAVVMALMLAGVTSVDPVVLATSAAYVILGVATLYFAYVFILGGLDSNEKKHVTVIVVLFIASAWFWSGFEQAGSSLNLFAERHTDRLVGMFDFEIPAGWFQSLNPAFIIIFAPMVASIWLGLARRNMNPSTPVKFALGLIIMALGFLTMMFAARFVLTGDQVLPTWLIFTYLFHTLGELCLSPVGLSAVTKLAPARYAGQMMGIWFMSISIGNLMAGLIAGKFDPELVEEMPSIFWQITWGTVLVGVILLLFSKPIANLMKDVR